MTTPRMSRAEHYLKVAEAVATLGECRRTQVGAVIVAADRIWATGRNGTEPGSDLSCLRGQCPRGRYTKEEVPSATPFKGWYTCIATHAEANAVAQFQEVVFAFTDSAIGPWDPKTLFSQQHWARSLISLPHWRPIMYVNHTPCAECAALLDFAGIETIYPARLLELSGERG